MPDKQQIEQQEGALTFARIGELDDSPVEGKLDAAHLKEVHRRIFQDLPHHAPGEYRPDAPAHIKARALEASGHRYRVHYAQRSQVDAGVEKVLSEFGGPGSLRGLNVEQFSGRMAKLYGDLDHLHPFKEGNSRTLRAFTAQLAREAGHELTWNTNNADAASRDRLYIARDKEVMQRAFPGLDQDRAMKTDSRAEYEAYVRFVAPFSKADTLEKLIKDSTRELSVEPPSRLSSVAPDAARAAVAILRLAAQQGYRRENASTAARADPGRAADNSAGAAAAVLRLAALRGIKPQEAAPAPAKTPDEDRGPSR